MGVDFNRQGGRNFGVTVGRSIRFFFKLKDITCTMDRDLAKDMSSKGDGASFSRLLRCGPGVLGEVLGTGGVYGGRGQRLLPGSLFRLGKFVITKASGRYCGSSLRRV